MLSPFRLWLAIFLVGGVVVSLFFTDCRTTQKKRMVACREAKWIAFDESMGKRDLSFLPRFFSKQMKKRSDWMVVKKLYQKNVLQATPSPQVRIPKIIHQIWLGSALPEKYIRLQKSWKENHPDWEYRLWTDESVKSFKMQNQTLFDTATNWGEKADILRYEILYQIGGLYVDTDFECVRAFDSLHHLCDFYVGLETLEHNMRAPRMGNALIGAAPGHPIMKLCLESMRGEGARDNCDLIQQRTGPGHLARCFFKACNVGNFKNVALPFTYFYPLPATERDGTLGGAIKTRWIQDESFAIHYWDTSWIPKK